VLRYWRVSLTLLVVAADTAKKIKGLRKGNTLFWLSLTRTLLYGLTVSPSLANMTQLGLVLGQVMPRSLRLPLPTWCTTTSFFGRRL
jgi:hypothetical protein